MKDKHLKIRVVIIEKSLKFYRLHFYNLLRENLGQKGIELILVYGSDDKITFNDEDMNWGKKITNYTFTLFGRRLYYQSALKYIKDADLIIIDQASSSLINYFLWILNLIRYRKVAYWGHGKNFQSTSSFSFSEIIKKYMTRSIYWFFAYNELSKQILIKNGYPETRITCINNTIDVENISEELNKFDRSEVIRCKEELGIKSDNVCVYIGGMYKEKRIGFIIESLLEIKRNVKDLEVIFIGDGPERDFILELTKTNDWIQFLGFQDHIEKIPYLRLSKLILIPGAVGLVVIDSFIFGVPLITTDCKLHGPEIYYLENGKNGIMTDNNITSYSRAIIDLLQNEDKRQKLVAGCKNSVDKYSMKSMVDKFTDGIISALNFSRKNQREII